LPHSKKNLNRGDVVLVLYPNSDLRTAKLRPALVVQGDGLNTGLPQIIVAMISSRTMRASHPSRVLISRVTAQGVASRLLVDSVVMTDNIATVALNAVHRAIGKLPHMRNVDIALRRTLGL
jgi:mRNA interferase MazF